MSTLIYWLVSLAAAYLIGSLSSAIIVCKALGLEDPRTQGSKNPGATNVLRLGGKAAAATVLVFDILKGFIAVKLATLFGVFGFALSTVALAAVIGHMYPIFFGFEGGKGVATAVGAMFGLSLWLGLALVIVWLASTYFTRYVSLGSIIAAATAPFFCLIFGFWSYIIPIAIMSLLVIYRHMDNIQRLREGREDKLKFGEK